MKENIMKRFAGHFITGSAAVFFLVAGIFSPEVSATAIFEYESSCVTNCDDIGLTAGDPVGGTIGFNDPAVAAGFAGFADVELFNVNFGTFTFDLFSLGSGSALFDSAGVVSFDFSFAAFAGPSTPGYNFSETAWIAGPSRFLAAGGGAGTLTAVPNGAANVVPVADAGGPYTGTAGVAVSFDGSGSSDSDGSIVSYAWDFGDGNGGSGVTPTHTYDAAGTYTVTLTVTDDDGASDSAMADLHVVPPPTTPVDLSGTIKTPDGTDICAMVLASGQYMFSCNPVGVFSLEDLPRESNGTVKRQIYADGFFPEITVVTESGSEAFVMTSSGTCPNYNIPYDPAFVPDSAGKEIYIAGQVLLQDTQTPICAMVLANGQYMFSCDGTGSYFLKIPLDTNGQFKLQVYADGFAPWTEKFDEFKTTNIVRMARAVECQ